MLTQQTIDHTEAQHMRDTGMPAEWIGPRAENTVRASIGRGAIASIRVMGPVGRLLLCSDGVHRHLSPDTMSRILRAHKDPRRAATRLVRVARRAGSTDNATALVIDAPASTNSRYHHPPLDSHSAL
ncbi:PP2C family protein-serine/threonine phosphatase [Micromonospora sp. NPDC051141]|uniref:PP2C family protein-serine/threonine phosphatase n=1 Tax=Micromonospora sp. NPDC051141 TaxID=3364284 RepID=UPI00379710D5